MIKVLSIIGATASGKSDLALLYAERFNGEIISCDSVQIYRYFNIGSAKPSPENLQKIPHHLINFLEPTSPCNAGLWREWAIAAVEDIALRGKLPIIVGGTGLYLKTLYWGMFEKESRNQDYREYLQKRSIQEGVEILYGELQSQDLLYAQKITPRDHLRIIRALEAMYVTKMKFSELHQHNTKPQWDWVFTMPTLQREEIYSKITERVGMMMGQGLVEETRTLWEKYGDTAPIRTIGYRHALEYILGQKSLQEMSDTLIQDTRRFAKRQLSLFRSLVNQDQISDPYVVLKKGIPL